MFEVSAINIAIASAAGLGLYQGIKWLRDQNSQHDDGFRLLILRDASNLVAKRMNRTSDSVYEALANERIDAANAEVMRVECVITKLGSDECECKTIVAIAVDENLVAMSATRSVTWADLPSQVRHDFIQHAGTPQSYVMYEKGNSSKEGV